MIKPNLSKEEKKLVRQSSRRTLSMSASFNFEKMQALGFLYAMLPYINHYHKSKEKRIEAYQREWTLFNTTPTCGPYITGTAGSLEKRAAEDPDFDPSMIETTKASLMGPMASFGDHLFWGTLRLVSLTVGIILALQGSILGALMHILIFNIPATLVRYYGGIVGFSEGTAFMGRAAESGVIDFVKKAATILALLMAGVLASRIVRLEIPYSFSFFGETTTLQGLLNQVFPGLLPLLMVLGAFALVKKGVQTYWVLPAILAVSLAGAYFGFLA